MALIDRFVESYQRSRIDHADAIEHEPAVAEDANSDVVARRTFDEMSGRESGRLGARRDAWRRLAVAAMEIAERGLQAAPPLASDPGADDGRAPRPAIVGLLSPPIFSDPHADAGAASYVAGLLTAAAFMALAIGPGWLGFVVGFLPMSLLTSWAVSSHA